LGLSGIVGHQSDEFSCKGLGSKLAYQSRRVRGLWLRPLFRKDWIVYSKPPFVGPEYVLQYLGRYTQRVAISNHRLVALADAQVTFRWRDSADHNQQKVMTASRDEFLRRFLLHLLPKGFVRIRHFGFLANRRRTALLPRCFAALYATPGHGCMKSLAHTALSARFTASRRSVSPLHPDTFLPVPA
jgi:hypothetical protein